MNELFGSRAVVKQNKSFSNFSRAVDRHITAVIIYRKISVLAILKGFFLANKREKHHRNSFATNFSKKHFMLNHNEVTTTRSWKSYRGILHGNNLNLRHSVVVAVENVCMRDFNEE
jgi:hypothetical protein